MSIPRVLNPEAIGNPDLTPLVQLPVVDPLDVIQLQKLELAKLRDAFDDAVALLRDWEDYDPDDPECGWQKRRDEFLAEHEEAGR